MSLKKLLPIFLVLLLVMSFGVECQLGIKIMAANTTSGRYQEYQGPGIRIFQAFKPDICCIQEFNYNGSIDELVQQAFGYDYRYYREPYTGSGDIPNGVIYHKKFQLLDSGSWNDPSIPNRGLTYARFDLPGNNPHLFVVSAHLSTKSHKQQAGAKALIQYIYDYFNVDRPEDIPDYVVLGADLNAGSRGASVMRILTRDYGGLFNDKHVPTDQSGNSGTNSSRRKDHDYVITNYKLTRYIQTLMVKDQSFPNGLVFDSRHYYPLSDVHPVEKNDSGAQNMQHMAIIKYFVVPTE